MRNPLKLITDYVDDYRSHLTERDRTEICNKFNIRRIDGVDYIVYGGLIVSMPGDTDLTDRIAFLRSCVMKGL